MESTAKEIYKYWFIDYEFPDEWGKPYKSSRGRMVESDQGLVPSGWRLTNIGNEIQVLGGGTPSTSIVEYWQDGMINWYSPTDLTRSRSLFSLQSEKKITLAGLENSSARLFPKYSILLTSRATIGEITININEACTNQGFITLIPNKKLPLSFLHNWLNGQLTLIHRLASGSTFPEINKTDFRALKVLVPPEAEIKRFSDLTNPIYKKIENNIIQIQALRNLRNMLLPKLISGKIRVKT